MSAVGNHIHADIQYKECDSAFIQQFDKQEYRVSDISDPVEPNVLFIFVPLAEIHPEETTLTL